MASDLMGQVTTTGFVGAPVTKFIVGFASASHVALQIPMFAWLGSRIQCYVPSIFTEGEVWRLAMSKLVFLSTKDAIMSLMLFYQFRVFERRFGSRKFSSHLLSVFVVTVGFELAATLLLQRLKPAYFPPNSVPLSTGPFGLVFPWFVHYYMDIPSTTSLSSALGTKGFNYLLGLHVASSSIENAVVVLSSVAAGLLCRLNFLWVQSWLKVPLAVSSAFDRVLGWLVRSSPSSSGSELLGATLDIQRAEQMEAIEQRLIRQNQMETMRHFGGGGGRRAGVRVGQGFAEQLVNPMIGGRMANAEDIPEDRITMLTDMGFPRDRALMALRQTGNDVQAATAILLHGGAP